MDPYSLFSLNDHLEALSRYGDSLKFLERTVVAGRRAGLWQRQQGERPPFDPVALFKVVILQVQHNLSDARMGMDPDRLSWMRFLGFSLSERTPDENPIRRFHHRMTETGIAQAGNEGLRLAVAQEGVHSLSGQIVDASLVPAPKQGNTDSERDAIKTGKSADETCRDEPAKAAQKDTDARWTLKIGGKARYRPDGTPLPMIAMPVFGYKRQISIDRRYGSSGLQRSLRRPILHGRMLRQVIDRENTGSEVWADSAYQSLSNEAWLADRM
jgi:hypothetical protein